MKILLFTGLFLLITQFGFSQIDNYQKNRLATETEDARYEKALKENPESAIPHWEHANRMAEFTFNAYKNAGEFYIKALAIDSTNAKIYEDYGDYLFNKLEFLKEAKNIYEKALGLAVNNRDLQEKLAAVNEALRNQK